MNKLIHTSPRRREQHYHELVEGRTLIIAPKMYCGTITELIEGSEDLSGWPVAKATLRFTEGGQVYVINPDKLYPMRHVLLAQTFDTISLAFASSLPSGESHQYRVLNELVKDSSFCTMGSMYFPSGGRGPEQVYNLSRLLGASNSPDYFFQFREAYAVPIRKGKYTQWDYPADTLSKYWNDVIMKSDGFEYLDLREKEDAT